MKKALLPLMLFTLALTPFKVALACLNDGSPEPSENFLQEHDPLKSIRESMTKNPPRLYDERYRNKETDPEFFTEAHKSALQELLTGDLKKAIGMFLELEQRDQLYASAANLGTAYELSGDNHNALKWIKEGLKRNPASHYGTEWLHVAILEAKINLEKDPGYYAEKSVLDMPKRLPADADDIFASFNGQNFNRIQVETALAYQLYERTIFVKPEDIVVADLLYSLSRIAGNKNDFKASFAYLDLAKEYGFKDEKRWKDSLSCFKEKQYAIETLQPLIMAGLAATLFLLTVLFVWRDRRKRTA
ncbi:MAG: hypothetical protein KA099_06925 [Alphaproteobacteria bacterium]|nr:hypothetical protein [Alphaproteobacteria bacterium]MBP7759708.1 hypothetical protein [Alphaproteobacteria bacterium]MBP7762843.1 hypothetical protein [Alphaproteobacteria bacterium]MBP7905042.1 hypothetical protein [Alphaproteobacteria bacterium]